VKRNLDLHGAEICELRAQAAAKREELGTLEKKTGRLLAELSKLESIEYESGILSAARRGTWYSPQGDLVPPPPYFGPGECFWDPTNQEPFARPRSRRLRQEIEELEAKAREMELSPAGANGRAGNS